jgi:hypothetical protein
VLRFGWETKNAWNKRKRGVSLEESKSAFGDEFGHPIADPGHLEEADHFLLLMGIRRPAATVDRVPCYRHDTIGIISAEG